MPWKPGFSAFRWAVRPWGSHRTTLCLGSIITSGTGRVTAAPSQGGWGGLNPSTFGTLQRVYDPQSAFYESWQTSLPRPPPSRNFGHFPECSPASGSGVSL